MATGKYLSLEEARKLKKLDRFAKEHPTKGSKSLLNIDLLILKKYRMSRFYARQTCQLGVFRHDLLQGIPLPH